MTTANIESFNVEPRKQGRHWSRKSRIENKIPAVIYGPKMENKNVLMDEIFIVKHRSQKYESAIFKTQSDDANLGNINVMLKKIQYHPVSNRPVHVDLYALDMTQTVRVKIPVKYEGEPVGCKEEGGVRQIILHEIEIECSPTSIPENVVVDISGLKLNTSLHVSEMSFPEGVKLITAAERTAVTISMPKEEKAEETAAPAEGDAAAAGDDKKAEEKK